MSPVHQRGPWSSLSSLYLHRWALVHAFPVQSLFRGRNFPLLSKWLVVCQLYAHRRTVLRDSIRAAGSPMRNGPKQSDTVYTSPCFGLPSWHSVWGSFYLVPVTSKRYWLEVCDGGDGYVMEGVCVCVGVRV